MDQSGASAQDHARAEVDHRTITAARQSEIHHPSGARIFATYHPSAALRAPDEAARKKLTRMLADDLARAAAMARKGD